MADQTRPTGMIIGVVVVALLGVIVGAIMMNSRNDTPGERLGNAAEEVSDGVEDAAEELQDRSPAEKVGDAIEDTGDAIKDSAR